MGEAAKQEMSRSEWLEERKKYIGGSDAAASLGLSRWKSRLDLCREKWGELIVKETPQMARGIVLERVVEELYHRHTGHAVEVGPWVVSEEYPWMAATPDLDDKTARIIVQLKTTSTWTRESWGDADDPTIPQDYYLQCQHEMAVTGAVENCLAVFFGDQSTFRGLVWMVKAGMEIKKVTDYVQELIADADSPCEFLPIPIPRDDDLIANMIEGEQAFWNTYVVPHVEPPDATIPQTSTDIITADTRQREMLGTLREAKRAENLAKDFYESLKPEIITELGEKSGIKAEGICSITYKAPKPTCDTDYEAMVAHIQAQGSAPNTGKAVTANTTRVTDWAGVFKALDLDAKKRKTLLAAFSTETQGKRVFRPRFAKD